MRGLVWGLYGLGAVVGLLIVLDGSIGVTPKTLIVMVLALFAALLAAILHVAEVVQAGSLKDEASAERFHQH